MSALRIAIVGGGIGGLSAGLALLKAGFDVHVYEQAPRFGEIDAGLQISPKPRACCIGWGCGNPALGRATARRPSKR